MRIPNGYPIQTVTEQEYVDGIDDCIERQQLVAGEQYTLRLIRQRKSPENFAADYPVHLDEVFSYVIDRSMRSMAAFRPISPEGVVMPNVRLERILQSGLLIKSLRLVMFNDFMKSHDGYFVGTDDINDEWFDLETRQPVGVPVEPVSELLLV